MASDLVELPTRYGRGLNLVDAPDALAPGQASVLENWRITGQGWLTSRKAAIELSAPDGDVITIIPYNQEAGVGAVLVIYDAVGDLCELWTVDGSGESATNVGTMPGYASGITSRPQIVGAQLGRVVFICDTAKVRGLLLYDPNDVLGSGDADGMYQPTFDFDANASFDEAFPRLVVEHLNHIWMFGYGDEGDPNRGEFGRFSYLGLLDDGQGSGDAGIGGAAGSEDLFDETDVVPVAPRGEEVVSAASVNGRLLICTERRALVVYGSGRDSWRLDQLDNQRGSVVTTGMIEADGIGYWLSPLGPARYRGGAVVEDLSRRVQPLLNEIDFSSVVAAVHPDEKHVRWYYRLRTDTVAGADRWIGWDYLHEEFVADVVPYRVYSAGSLRPSGAEGPAAAPSSLTFTDVVDFTAKVTWVNGDTSPGTRTLIYRAPDVASSPGTYVLLDRLGSGVGEYLVTGLDPVTTYWIKIEHIRNGQVSAGTVEDDFTTTTTGTLPVPTNVKSVNDPIFEGGQFKPSVLTTWDFADIEGGLKFHVDRNVDGGGYNEVEETDFGVASYRDNDVSVGEGINYRVSAEDQDGNTSAESAVTAVTVSVDDPYAEWPDED